MHQESYSPTYMDNYIIAAPISNPFIYFNIEKRRCQKNSENVQTLGKTDCTRTHPTFESSNFKSKMNCLNWHMQLSQRQLTQPKFRPDWIRWRVAQARGELLHILILKCTIIAGRRKLTGLWFGDYFATVTMGWSGWNLEKVEFI